MSASVTRVSDTAWTSEGDEHARALFSAEGMRCASCARAIERAVGAVPGVVNVRVNVATSRVSVDWRSNEANLTKILEAVSAAGFKPTALSGDAAEKQFQDDRRAALKRIGLAGLGSMQVMMYVLGLYVGTPADMDPGIASMLRYVGLIITTPILIYSGAPFFLAAWKSLRQRSLGMDVPVALALALAYIASVYNTVTASGQTYFDSVAMFIFLLSVGRYIEMTVRRRSLTTSEALGKSLPSTVSRLKPDNTTERVSIHDVVPTDRLSIPRGAVIPVDAALASDTAFVDEALITGESTPVRRSQGDRLLSGSVNTGDAIQVIAQQNDAGSTLASIVALLERTQSGRPRLNGMADRAASWFVGAVLIVSIVVAVVWWFIDPSRAFPAALAVLVVTCPCALSLATPVATAAATVRLARLGILVTRADTLERLARVDTVVLDKTGTLTMGNVRVQGVTLLGPYDRETSLAVAAALECVSDHPLAQAFAPYFDPSIVASGHREIVGSGVEARVGSETWRLGRHAFVAQLFETAGEQLDPDALYLANTRGLAAAFEINQEMRPDARDAIQNLKALKLAPIIASGDRTRTVLQVACALGIDFAVGRLNPENKLSLVRDLQSKGHRVLMIGDGVNDGPVLAAADVSCAMGQGSAVAQAAADMMLLRDSLNAVTQSIAASRRMIQVMRQNLGWSIVYNFSAVPLAAMDILPPWVAALGMSISSLFVVLNASRIA